MCGERGCGRTGRVHKNVGRGDRGRGASGIIRDRLPKALIVFSNGWEELTNKVPYQIISVG